MIPSSSTTTPFAINDAVQEGPGLGSAGGGPGDAIIDVTSAVDTEKASGGEGNEQSEMP